MGRVFWTDIQSLEYKGKKGKIVKVASHTAKIVLLSIADSSDDFGENSWNSFETLAKKSSVTRRTVIRVVRALIENGYMRLAGTSIYGTNNYSVMVNKLGNLPKKRSKNGRPKTSDSEAKTSDSEAKTSVPESPYPSSSVPTHNIYTDEDFATVSNAIATLQGGGLKSGSADLFDTWLEIHSVEWILKAVALATAQEATSKHNSSYVDGILRGWERDGYPAPRKNPKQNKSKFNATPQAPAKDNFTAELAAKKAKLKAEMANAESVKI